MLRILRKGQSTAEYAIVIGLVIAAAVAMQIYVKRSLQGKVKDAVDYNDPAASGILGTTTQYEPYYSTSAMNATRSSTDTEDTATGGSVARTTVDSSSRTGTQNILAVQ
ncbi:MAG: hypothetical protein KJ710_01080 [Candidatus Omnitrophica bacterium]|nr:hypothetical protein [Candidatus Omnitrophota bacterium]MBU1922843.1 hypothetical protein [Candidatus Omnitrophota bacterium]